jgi:hypothetical protein
MGALHALLDIPGGLRLDSGAALFNEDKEK